MASSEVEVDVGCLQPPQTGIEARKEALGEDPSGSSSAGTMVSQTRLEKIKINSLIRKMWYVITWTPPRCRWDLENPPEFSMGLNLLYGFASTFTVANLYYNHPILNILAEEFNVSFEKASIVPTVMQAGYAAGLLFLCPLGDVFRRRAFVLSLVWFTATVWLGLCLTTSFPLFATLSFITAITTTTPQLMIPLVGDLAPPAKRPTAISIMVSGLILGMLLARVFAGIITQYTSWRTVYLLAFGMQYLVFALLWLFMPDYPVTNPAGINYLKMLWSIPVMVARHPVLAQACAVGGLATTTFTSYWTTLTFQLAVPPYRFSPLLIGLIAITALLSIFLSPFCAHYIIARHPPLYSVLLGLLTILLGVLVGTYTPQTTKSAVAAPIFQAIAIDLGLQTSQIANRAAIYTVEPRGRNRVNTAYMVAVFAGQIVGTAVGNRLYALGGWKASGGASVGFVVMGLVFVVARGPREEGWFGWTGGWRRKRRGTDGDNGSEEVEEAIEISSDVNLQGDIEKGTCTTSTATQRRHEVTIAVNKEKGFYDVDKNTPSTIDGRWLDH